jgi:hypothetical protein
VLGGNVVVGVLVLVPEDEVLGPLVVVGPLVVKTEDEDVAFEEIEDEDEAFDEVVLEEGPVAEELQFPN